MFHESQIHTLGLEAWRGGEYGIALEVKIPPVGYHLIL
jgi:hypothetical protein